MRPRIDEVGETTIVSPDTVISGVEFSLPFVEHDDMSAATPSRAANVLIDICFIDMNQPAVSRAITHRTP